MKKALLVGINDYPGTGNDLAGCVNDAHDWAQVLSQRCPMLGQLAQALIQLRTQVADLTGYLGRGDGVDPIEAVALCVIPELVGAFVQVDVQPNADKVIAFAENFMQVQTMRTLASCGKVTAPTWLPISERAPSASHRRGPGSAVTGATGAQPASIWAARSRAAPAAGPRSLIRI